MINTTEEEVSRLCSDLVRFDSAHPRGLTDECVDYIKAYLDKHGIENEILTRDKRKPNIVAKIHGEKRVKVLWIGHLDVVPAGKPENWSHPPYEGVIEGGYVYGRGSNSSNNSGIHRVHSVYGW